MRVSAVVVIQLTTRELTSIPREGGDRRRLHSVYDTIEAISRHVKMLITEHHFKLVPNVDSEAPLKLSPI